MTKNEQLKLLKHLGAAYAFILDLRQAAIQRVDVYNIRLTAGIDQAIVQAEADYPRTFRRYFSVALKKAQVFREKQAQAQAAREAATQGRTASPEKGKAKAKQRRK